MPTVSCVYCATVCLFFCHLMQLFPQTARVDSYFKHRKRCLCALWSLGAGGAAASCGCRVLPWVLVPLQGGAAAARCRWPCAIASLRAGVAAGCQMCVAVCALSLCWWCRYRHRVAVARCLWQFEVWSLGVGVAAGRCRPPLPKCLWQ